jgi:hypothetical protein
MREAYMQYVGCKKTFPCVWRIVTSIQLASGQWWPLHEKGAATHTCWLTGWNIKAICQSKWNWRPETQDSLFQGPGVIRDDQGITRWKDSPFIRPARQDGVRFLTTFTGWLIQSLTPPLMNRDFWKSLSLSESQAFRNKMSLEKSGPIRRHVGEIRVFKGKSDTSFLKLQDRYIRTYYIVILYNLFVFCQYSFTSIQQSIKTKQQNSSPVVACSAAGPLQDSTSSTSRLLPTLQVCVCLT